MSKEKYSEEIWFDKLPDSSLEVHEENFFEFFRTMYERQEIWYKRFMKQPQPWTEDKILAEGKFTNVYRMLDRQSQYLLSQIIIPYGKQQKNKLISVVNSDIDMLFYYIMFYKLFNNNEFFEFLKKSKYKGIPSPDEYNADEFEIIMTEARIEGINPFTNAYLTNSQACPGKTRDWCFSHKGIPSMIKIYDKIKDYYDKPAEDLIRLLETMTSVSSFLSHEFYQDFTYIPMYTDFDFPFTQDDYTNVGPGADTGIRLIFPNRKTKAEKIQAISDLRDLSKEVLQQFGDFKYVEWSKKKSKYTIKLDGKLKKHQIEMFLCEYQKYWKMFIGQGKQRSKITIGQGKDYSFYLY